MANTTLGATTTEQGHFELPGVPAGTYDLVASYVGYRLARRTVVVSTTPQSLTLALAPTANQLGEVVVRPKKANPRRADDYLKFKELFLGHTTFSQQCHIRNPKAIDVDFDPQANELTASADEFVQVDNDALGYRIKYYGLQFKTNFTKQYVTFYGQPVFEEMTPRNPRQQQRWAANRALAYRGSLTHFLRSVRENRVAVSGFEARRLRFVPNPRFARADSLRRALLRQKTPFSAVEQDSLAHWAQVPRGFAMLYTAVRPVDSLRRVAAGGAHIFLRFRDNLQVTYLREAPDAQYQPAPPGTRLPLGQVSRLSLLEPEAEIQPNGQLTNPLAVFTDNYWGFEKMGEFLPVNYLPPAADALPAPTHDK